MIDNNSKETQRSNYKVIRNKVLPQVENLIIEKVTERIQIFLTTHKQKGFLGIYWPLHGEVDLRGLKVNLTIPIALPASREKGLMTYHPWTDSQLRKDFYGIPAPLDEPILKPQDMSLLLVPAIAIDQHGYRLGYGGGFFDRLRAKKDWRSIPALVILPKACVSKEPLPKNSWDIPFDGWINEEGNFRRINTA